MDVLYIPIYPLMELSAVTLAAQWQAIGINAEPRSTELGVWLDLRTKTFDYWISTNLDFPTIDPDVYLYDTFHSSSAPAGWDAAELEQWLTARRHENSGGAVSDPTATRGRLSGRVELKVAQRGDKAALAQTAEMNAKNALILYKTRRSSDFVARSKALNDIQDALGMADAPLRMECFDVSHLSGTNVVASMAGCAGQRCMAAASMLAVGDVETVVRQVCEEARKLVPGRNLGPVISAGARTRIESAIAARACGASANR